MRTAYDFGPNTEILICVDMKAAMRRALVYVWMLHVERAEYDARWNGKVSVQCLSLKGVS